MKKKILGVLIAITLLTVGFTAIPIMAESANHLDRVQITPASAALAVGTTQQFSAQAYDESNQPISDVTYFWLVIAGGGAINSTGLFTAGTVPGTYSNTVEVLAVQGTTVKLASATVAVVTTIGPLHHVKVTPATANVVTGGTKQFTAQGYDSADVPITGLTYVWSGVGTVGTLSPTTGLFSAGTTIGTYTVQASTTQGTITQSASAIVTVTTTPASTPTPANHGRSNLFRMFKDYLKNIGSDNFLGGQWQVKNGSNIDTIRMISGVVQTASATSLTMLPNGQPVPSTFTLTTSTIIQPEGTVFAANDKVMVVTVNDQVTMVAKIKAPGTSEEPPGLNKQDDDKHEGKDTPHGRSNGNKTGWNKDSSEGNNESDSDND
jgi:hypothetical protein